MTTAKLRAVRLTRLVTELDMAIGQLRGISAADDITPEEAEIVRCATMLANRARGAVYMRYIESMDAIPEGGDHL